MTWQCNICQNINAQSTWCCNPKCGARWDSTPDKAIYSNTQPRAGSTAAQPASARSEAGGRLARQEAERAGWPPRGRSNSRTRGGKDKGGKGNGKNKDQDGKGKIQDAKPKIELEPWLKDTVTLKNPPWVSMTTWQQTLSHPGLPPPPADDATKDTHDAYHEQIRETMRLAITTHKMEWVMRKPCDATGALIGACRRRLLNAKSLDDQLKVIEKYTVLGEDRLQELCTYKENCEDMLQKINLHIEHKRQDLKTLQSCREEVSIYQRALNEQKEQERKHRLGKSPFDPAETPAGAEGEDDEELLDASANGASHSPFSSAPGASPFATAAATARPPPFADSVKSQTDMLNLIQQQVDKRMETVQNEFATQLLQVQRTLMEAMKGERPPTPRSAAPTPTAQDSPLTPTVEAPIDLTDPDPVETPPAGRQGQERLDREDRSPLRQSIKPTVREANKDQRHAAEIARKVARDTKLVELRAAKDAWEDPAAAGGA